MSRSQRKPPTLDYRRDPGQDAARPHLADHDPLTRTRRASRQVGLRGCYLWFRIAYILIGAAIALAGGWFVMGGGLERMLQQR